MPVCIVQTYLLSGVPIMDGFPALAKTFLRFGFCAFFTLLLSVTWARGPLPGVNADSKFIIYYGSDYTDQNGALNQTLINDLRRFDVVVLQPNQPGFTPAVVAALKDNSNGDGVNYVFGYISIGEDFLPANAPVYQPDNINQRTGPMVLRDGVLVPSFPNGNVNGIASFYIDVETQTRQSCNGGLFISTTRSCGTRDCANPGLALAECDPFEDGTADLNTNFLGYMVHPNADWRTMIKTMRRGRFSPYPTRQNKAGLMQIVGPRPDQQPDFNGDLAAAMTDPAYNYGMDGFFLDTIDTAGPYNDINWYPWTIGEMQATVQAISEDSDLAGSFIFANRGGFFFQAGLQSLVTQDYPIDFSIAPYVNAFLFESYLYDSAPGAAEGPLGESEFYEDNRVVQLPKVLAEASRADGFTVFTLEYDSGRSAGRESALIENVVDNTQKAFGATTYLATNGDLNAVNLTLADQADLLPGDQTAPQWLSTQYGFLNAASDYPARIGLQRAVLGDSAGSAVLAWDVAQDFSLPVRYVLYSGSSDDISQAERRVLDAGELVRSSDYNHNPTNALPFQVSLNGLADGTHYFWIRALDAAGNEDGNTRSQRLIIGAVPSNATYRVTVDGNLDEWAAFAGAAVDSDDIAGSDEQIDLLDLQFAHNAESLFVAYRLDRPTNFNTWGFQLYLDTDSDRNTGFTNYETFAIGADYLLQSGSLFAWQNNSWVATGANVQSANAEHVELALPLAALGSPRRLRALFTGNNAALPGAGDAVDYVPDGGGAAFLSYDLSAVTNPVANGAITVGDGSAADFEPLTAFPVDADDIDLPTGQTENIDWRSVTMAHDNNNLYFLYEAYGLIRVDYFLQVFIDSDGGRDTGYTGISDEMPVGADYMIEGQWLYRFDGTDPSQWSGAWTWLGTVGYSWFSNYGEIFIPRPWMNDPARLRLFFKGRNSDGAGGVIEDLYPDNALTPGAEPFIYVVD